MNIPDEAIEAAAMRVWVTDGELMRDPRPDWDECAKDPAWKAVMDETREVARSILEAATPHLMAQAWDEGLAMGWGAARGEPEEPNPYHAGAGE
jgi:hypothetical protein